MAKRHELPLTTDVPTFGRIALKIGRNAAYAAAKRKDFPTIPAGGLLRVPLRPALEPLFGSASPEERAAIISQFCEADRKKGSRAA